MSGKDHTSRITWTQRFCKSCHKKYYACQSQKPSVPLSDSIKFCPDCQFAITHPPLEPIPRLEKCTISIHATIILQDMIGSLPQYQQRAVKIYLENGSWYKNGERIGGRSERSFYEALTRLRNKKPAPR